MTDLRCWWCGVTPDDVIEDQQLCQPEPRRIPVWPTGDHQHTATPPTPQQLEAQGRTTYRRVMEGNS